MFASLLIRYLWLGSSLPRLEGVFVGNLYILAGDYSCVGVSSFNPSVPHEIVVREFAGVNRVGTSIALLPLIRWVPCISSWV